MLIAIKVKLIVCTSFIYIILTTDVKKTFKSGYTDKYLKKEENGNQPSVYHLKDNVSVSLIGCMVLFNARKKIKFLGVELN